MLFAFVWDPQGAKKQFLCKIAQFYIKIDIFATYVSNKKAEKENKIKIHTRKFPKYPKEHLDQFVDQSDHFPEP